MTSRTPSWLVDVPFAHRGLHGPGVPENTMPAFAAGADAGYGIELDVQLSGDGEAVVLHDLDLERVTGVSARARELSAAELGDLRLGGTRHAVPRLAEVLDLVGDRVPLMVELKSFGGTTGRLEKTVTKLLDEHPGPFCVSSFHPGSVRWFRRQRPEWLRGQAAGTLADVPMPRWLRPPLRHMVWNRWNEPDFVAYELAALPHPAVDRARRRGAAVIAWTVASAADLERARELADNVIFENVAP